MSNEDNNRRQNGKSVFKCRIFNVTFCTNETE